MRRGESIFELDPNAHDEVERGFELEGSNLSGVSARCSWSEPDPARPDKSDCEGRLNDEENFNTKSLQGIQDNRSLKSFIILNFLESTELLHVKKLEGVHLIFNLEAGSLLPLAIRYKSYFTNYV